MPSINIYLCITKLIKVNYLESNYNVLSITLTSYVIELSGALLTVYRYNSQVAWSTSHLEISFKKYCNWVIVELTLFNDEISSALLYIVTIKPLECGKWHRDNEFSFDLILITFIIHDCCWTMAAIWKMQAYRNEIPIISALGRRKQEEEEFKGNLADIIRPYLKGEPKHTGF